MKAPTPSRHRATAAAPLFVVGAPRSGTFLLYHCLALHPRAAWVSNYCRWLPELAALNRVAARASGTRTRLWFGETGDEADRYGVPRSVRERLFPQPVQSEPVLARRGVLPGDGCPPDKRARRLRTDFRRLARAAGGDVVVAKIGHNLHIPVLAAVFPEARFLAVTRDGRAVAHSLLYVDWWPEHELWWWEGTPIDWARTGHNPVDAAAEHWVREVDVIEHSLAALPPAQVSRLRYEDLVAEPHQSLEAVAEFAGLGPDPGWRESLEHVSFPNRNRRVRYDNAYERATEVQATMLATLGYR